MTDVNKEKATPQNVRRWRSPFSGFRSPGNNGAEPVIQIPEKRHNEVVSPGFQTVLAAIHKGRNDTEYSLIAGPLLDAWNASTGATLNDVNKRSKQTFPLLLQIIQGLPGLANVRLSTNLREMVVTLEQAQAVIAVTKAEAKLKPTDFVAELQAELKKSLDATGEGNDFTPAEIGFFREILLPKVFAISKLPQEVTVTSQNSAQIEKQKGQALNLLRNFYNAYNDLVSAWRNDGQQSFSLLPGTSQRSLDILWFERTHRHIGRGASVATILFGLLGLEVPEPVVAVEEDTSTIQAQEGESVNPDISEQDLEPREKRFTLTIPQISLPAIPTIPLPSMEQVRAPINKFATLLEKKVDEPEAPFDPKEYWDKYLVVIPFLNKSLEELVQIGSMELYKNGTTKIDSGRYFPLDYEIPALSVPTTADLLNTTRTTTRDRALMQVRLLAHFSTKPWFEAIWEDINGKISIKKLEESDVNVLDTIILGQIFHPLVKRLYESTETVRGLATKDVLEITEEEYKKLREALVAVDTLLQPLLAKIPSRGAANFRFAALLPEKYPTNRKNKAGKELANAITVSQAALESFLFGVKLSFKDYVDGDKLPAMVKEVLLKNLSPSVVEKIGKEHSELVGHIKELFYLIEDMEALIYISTTQETVQNQLREYLKTAFQTQLEYFAEREALEVVLEEELSVEVEDDEEDDEDIEDASGMIASQADFKAFLLRLQEEGRPMLGKSMEEWGFTDDDEEEEEEGEDEDDEIVAEEKPHTSLLKLPNHFPESTTECNRLITMLELFKQLQPDASEELVAALDKLIELLSNPQRRRSMTELAKLLNLSPQKLSVEELSAQLVTCLEDGEVITSNMSLYDRQQYAKNRRETQVAEIVPSGRFNRFLRRTQTRQAQAAVESRSEIFNRMVSPGMEMRVPFIKGNEALSDQRIVMDLVTAYMERPQEWDFLAEEKHDE